MHIVVVELGVIIRGKNSYKNVNEGNRDGKKIHTTPGLVEETIVQPNFETMQYPLRLPTPIQ